MQWTCTATVRLPRLLMCAVPAGWCDTDGVMMHLPAGQAGRGGKVGGSSAVQHTGTAGTAEDSHLSSGSGMMLACEWSHQPGPTALGHLTPTGQGHRRPAGCHSAARAGAAGRRLKPAHDAFAACRSAGARLLGQHRWSLIRCAASRARMWLSTHAVCPATRQ